jgi:hypothetical protein
MINLHQTIEIQHWCKWIQSVCDRLCACGARVTLLRLTVDDRVPSMSSTTNEIALVPAPAENEDDV